MSDEFYNAFVYDLVRLNERIDRAEVAEQTLRILASRDYMPAHIRARVLAEADEMLATEIMPLRQDRLPLVDLIKSEGPNARQYAEEAAANVVRIFS